MMVEQAQLINRFIRLYTVQQDMQQLVPDLLQEIPTGKLHTSTMKPNQGAFVHLHLILPSFCGGNLTHVNCFLPDMHNDEGINITTVDFHTRKHSTRNI